jgi:hypothetical protein
MKKLICLLLLNLVCCVLIHGQQFTFHKVYPGLPGEGMFPTKSTVFTHDGGILTGNHKTLMKCDSLGNLSWRMNTTSVDQVLAATFLTINKYNINNYFMAGSFLIASMDSNFNFKWMRTILQSNEFGFNVSKHTNDGGFILGGETVLGGFYPHACLTKIDSIGIVQWSKVYLHAPSLSDIQAVETCTDGGFIFCTNSRSVTNPGAVFDGVIIKTDSLGIVQWSKRLTGPSGSSTTYDIKIANEGGFVITGRNNPHRFLLKIDENGNKLWAKKYAIGVYGYARGVIETSDNGFAMVGELTDTTMFGLALTSCILKTDSTGNLEWARALGGFGNVSLGQILQKPDNSYLVSGRRVSSGDYKLTFVKTDSLGHTGGCLEFDPIVTVSNVADTLIDFLVIDSTVTITTVPGTMLNPPGGSEIDICAPFGFYEINEAAINFEILPNPTSCNFSIKFKHPLKEKTTLQGTSTTGKVILLKAIEAGTSHFETSIEHQPNGMYFLQLNSQNYTATKKIILQK